MHECNNNSELCILDSALSIPWGSPVRRSIVYRHGVCTPLFPTDTNNNQFLDQSAWERVLEQDVRTHPTNSTIGCSQLRREQDHRRETYALSIYETSVERRMGLDLSF
jgi:hypothetical protein